MWNSRPRLFTGRPRAYPWGGPNHNVPLPTSIITMDFNQTYFPERQGCVFRTD